MTGTLTTTADWRAAVERTVSGLDYELVDLERSAGGLLRVTIDRIPGREYPDGAEAVTVDDCERVTRQLQYVLQVAGVDYARLEVSSPGVDRPLKKPADFERFAGAEVNVRLRRALDGRRNFEGVLTLEGDGRYGLELIERPPEAGSARGAKGRKAGSKPGAKDAPGKAAKSQQAGQAAEAAGEAAAGRKLVFVLDEIERARLVPKLKFQERRK